ncbi:hypothetical protein [uncultured Williamsia sp.]|uniref:hypothetical protein n=1 Tax=uncultured Williamsia sp. TaxID=259311 RepID=UPI002610715B|nr:hypothetical protein [uncultured Williamsia sp.]
MTASSGRTVTRSRAVDWVVRGLILAVAHIAVRTAAGALTESAPLHSAAFRYSGTAIVILVAVAAGVVDGVSRRNRDTVDAYTWVRAAVVCAVVTGVVCSVLGVLEVSGLAGVSPGVELTSGLAWTFLITMVPAVLGMAVARRLRG